MLGVDSLPSTLLRHVATRLVLALCALPSATSLAAQQRAPVAPPTLEYTISAGPPASAVATTPLREYSLHTLPTPLGQVEAIVRLGSGQLIVATSQPVQITRFGPDGRRLGTIGRRGSGPGEYADLSGLAVLPGDSLVALDRLARRVLVYSPSGQPVRTWNLVPPFGGIDFDVKLDAAGQGDLLLGFVEFPARAPMERALETYTQLGRYSSAGRRISAIGRFFHGESVPQAAPDPRQGRFFWDRAFGRRGAIVVDGDRLLVSDGRAVGIDEYTLTGTLVRRHRVPVPTRPVTRAQITRLEADELRDTPPEEQVISRSRHAMMPYPDRLPAIGRVLAGTDGTIWLQRYEAGDASSQAWWRLDPAKRTAALLTFPPGVSPRLMTRTSVLALWWDEDDVEHLREYRLTVR